MQRQFITGILGLVLVVSLLPGVFAELRGVTTDSSVDVEANSINNTENSTTDVDVKNEDDDGPAAEIDRLREERRERLVDLREEIKIDTKLDGSMEVPIHNIVERRKEMLEDIKDHREELYDDRKAYLEKMHDEIKDGKDRLKELQSSYEDHKKAYVEARAEVKGKCETNNSQNCTKARKELNADAKKFMGNAAEQMLRIISNLETRVKAHPNIANETAANVLTELEGHKIAIIAAKAKVDALANSNSTNATKTAAAELRAAWVDARVTIRLTKGLLTHARFEEFLNHLDRVETRLKEARNALAAEGKDVTQLDEDLASFSVKIDVAATSYASVEQAYVDAMVAADTEEEANKLLREMKENLDGTRAAIKEARQDLREVLKDIKALSSDKLGQIAKSISEDAEAQATLEVEA